MESEKKGRWLHTPVEHIDTTKFDVVPLVGAMGRTAFTARDLARAAEIFDRMIADPDCGIILCLAGSLVSAGLKKVFVEMVRCRMGLVDAIVSTGANLVDQDFFEGLGFRHFMADMPGIRERGGLVALDGSITSARTRVWSNPCANGHRGGVRLGKRWRTRFRLANRQREDALRDESPSRCGARPRPPTPTSKQAVDMAAGRVSEGQDGAANLCHGRAW